MNVLVVEDHQLVREGLVRLLCDALPGSEVRVAATAKEADPHLGWAERLLLDLSLPDTHGLRMLSEVNERFPDLPVIILTAHDETAFRVRARELGAAAFLSKNDSSEALIHALAELSGPDDGGGVPRMEKLSPTEREVISLLGEGLINAQIAEKLGIEEKTVYTHRRHLMYKLGLENAQALLRFATLYYMSSEGTHRS